MSVKTSVVFSVGGKSNESERMSEKQEGGWMAHAGEVYRHGYRTRRHENRTLCSSDQVKSDDATTQRVTSVVCYADKQRQSQGWPTEIIEKHHSD